MKHLKLFENFSKIDIDKICKEYSIHNYTINKDSTVDVDGYVNLYSRGLTEIPLKFGRVTGYFHCGDNQLTSLDGCPKEVGGFFNCKNNQLTSLDGSPSEVGDNFSCHNNLLTTLRGSPIEVGGDFHCQGNKLTTLEGGPNKIAGTFYCNDNLIFKIYNLFGDYKEYLDSLDYNYLRGTNIVKLRLKEALEEIGKKLPERIKGYNYI